MEGIPCEKPFSVGPDLPLWKRQRRLIVESLVDSSVSAYNYDIYSLPTNLIRSNQKKDISEAKVEQIESILFDHFLIVCRRAVNTPYIQCAIENNKIKWYWKWSGLKKQNISRWLESCFDMATTLFDLQLTISRLRNDIVNGPTVFILCSLILRYLRKHVYDQLATLEDLEGKNLLTLQRHCGEIDIKILKPLRKLVRDIEQDGLVGGELINYFFQQKDQLDNYHIVDLLSDVISLAVERYYQVITEWISQCTLTFDLAHEFFIWDLSRQSTIDVKEIEGNKELNFTSFGKFVQIPQLIPEPFQSISKEIFKIGEYLYTMKQQNADIDLLAAHYLLDFPTFKDQSLGEFCSKIHGLYKLSSKNIFEHFRQRYDIVDFAKQLPCFFLGLNNTWIYEFAVHFEDNELLHLELDPNNKADNLLTVKRAFHCTELNQNPFYRFFYMKVSPFVVDNREGIAPPRGTYAPIELHVTGSDPALKLPFPVKVLEPYRKMFFHLFLLSRAKYLLHKKFQSRCTFSRIWARQELATIFLVNRFIHVYHEYIYVIVESAYSAFAREIDQAVDLDELISVQLGFVNDLMGKSKLDQENLPLKEDIVAFINHICEYASDNLDFVLFNKLASPIIGRIKKFLLEHKRSLNSLKELLFGCYFSAIGQSANDEPLWKLLLHMDSMPEV